MTATADALIGRDAELASLAAGATAARAGQASRLAVVGEAGLGKTALLAAARQAAERVGLQVVAGRAAEDERDVPFGVVADALDATAAGLGRRLDALGPARAAELAAALPSVEADIALPTAGERYRTHRALRALLELLGRERPIALVLDDLHWADAASLELVAHLLRRPPAVGHLLVLGMRPVSGVTSLLDALALEPGAEVLRLAPLSDAEARSLVGDLPEVLAREVMREAAGNPLYLRELARAAGTGERGLPASLVAAVRREVADLPPASRALLEGAAVAGDPFDPELAAAAAELEPDTTLPLLDRLVAAGLVAPADGPRRFAFRHPLVRRAVADGAASGWRVGAHERVATTLAKRGAPAVQQAHHVERSARFGDEDAIAVLERAGAEAAATAPSAAAHFYAQALTLVGDDQERRLALGVPHALALARTGRLEEALAALVTLIDLVPSGAMHRALVTGCADVEHLLGRPEAATARLAALIERDDGGGHVQAQLARTGMWGGQGGAATLQWAEAAAARADPQDLALASSVASLRALGEQAAHRPERARALYDEAVAAFARLDDEGLAAHLDAALDVGTAHLFLERYGPAAQAADRGLAVARATGQDRLLVPLAVTASMGHTNSGDVATGLARLEPAEEGARLAGLDYMLAWALGQRAAGLYLAGDGVRGRRVEAECRDLIARLPETPLTLAVRSNLASEHVEEDPAAALDELTSAGGGDMEHGIAGWSTHLLRAAVVAALSLGDLAAAERYASVAEARAADYDLPVSRARALTARAAVARDPAVALEAVAVADGAQAAIDGLRARILAGRLQSESGDRGAALELLRDAEERALAAGALRLRDEAARELRRLGSRPSAVARGSGAAGLSAREGEIAARVAAGASNKEVAAALFLSEKTVANALSRVFAKLGVRSRTELAAAYREGSTREG